MATRIPRGTASQKPRREIDTITIAIISRPQAAGLSNKRYAQCRASLLLRPLLLVLLMVLLLLMLLLLPLPWTTHGYALARPARPHDSRSLRRTGQEGEGKGREEEDQKEKGEKEVWSFLFFLAGSGGASDCSSSSSSLPSSLSSFFLPLAPLPSVLFSYPSCLICHHQRQPMLSFSSGRGASRMLSPQV